MKGDYVKMKTRDEILPTEPKMIVLDKKGVRGNLAEICISGNISVPAKSLDIKPKDFNLYIDGSSITVYDRTSRKLEQRYNRIIIIVD